MSVGEGKSRDDAFEGHVVGKRHRKVGAMDRLRGSTRYTADLARAGTLCARIKRSPHAHARVIGVDSTKALAMDGVVAVLTGKDFPVPYGIIPWTRDEHALAPDKALYVGDGVAAVAAVSEEVAVAALEQIDVHYEPLPAYFDPAEALRADVAINPHVPKGNRSKRVELAFGDVDQELEGADLVLEGEYFFEGTTHAALEPHAALAEVDGSGVLTVWSATQVPHYLHRELARVLDLPAHRIRVIQPPIGGAFGGKSEPFDLEFVVALFALRTGKPVALTYTREEVFYAHRGRHPMEMHFRSGWSADGRMHALDARTLIDGGAYSSFGLVTTYYSGQLACSPYQLAAYRFDSTRVITNKPACGPKRGHGSVQPRFALEVQIDEAAVALGLDPIEVRRQNAMGADSRTVNELLVGSNGFLECLDQVEEASRWKERRGKLPHGRGLGVAGSTYISGTNYPIYPNEMPQTAVHMALDRSGRVTVFSGASDIGQGVDTVLGLVAAEELGVNLEDVRVVSGDTDLCPVDLGAYSSRLTLMVGNAALDAARSLRRLVTDSVAKRWEVPRGRVVLADRSALDREDPSRTVPIAEAFEWAETDHASLGATGSYNTPKDRHGEYRGGAIGASPAYSFTAHVAEVDVDVETGEVNLVQMWVAHDCGRALSRGLVEGQMEGSTYMGAAEALFEVHRVDPDHGGLHTGPSLLDYRLPTALDAPHVESLIVEAPDDRGPYGAKEAGEGPLHSSIPAIANAVYDAVGVRLRTLPLAPEKVLAALEEGSWPGAPTCCPPSSDASSPHRDW
ncbi:MAG: molybdopterin-dependent oxidoreductase [Deltaproteobacteria bacterium]|nr:molybdopterin-dependent oxidoreductase [Deltaproteobacteria bacterium]